MKLDEIIYSTKAPNLKEHILSQQAGRGDYPSMLGYILCRTNMPEEDALNLDDEDLLFVITKIGEAMLQGLTLQRLSKDFGNGVG